MTTNNPPIAAWAPSTALAKLASRHNNAPCVLTDGPAEFNDVALIRLSDYQRLQADHERLQAEYEEELFCVRQTRDTHFGEMMRAIEQVDAMKAECEELRAELNLWSPIHDEVIRRAEKQHCLQDRCDFEVTVMYEDYAAIQDPNHENQ